jgi:hypothetical protein
MTATDFRFPDTHDWKLDAECSKLGSPNMFPADEDHEAIDAARATCHACPVMTACLAAAQDRKESYGVWGGLTPAERRTARSQRVMRRMAQT